MFTCVNRSIQQNKNQLAFNIMVSWVFIKGQGRVLVCGAKIILTEFSI